MQHAALTYFDAGPVSIGVTVLYVMCDVRGSSLPSRYLKFQIGLNHLTWMQDFKYSQSSSLLMVLVTVRDVFMAGRFEIYQGR